MNKKLNRLTIFSNKNNTSWTIAEEDTGYDMGNLDDIADITGINEIKIVDIMKNYEADVKYYDYRKDEYCTHEDYIEHFKEYDSDNSYILPNCTFNNYDKAKDCLSYIKQSSIL